MSKLEQTELCVSVTFHIKEDLDLFILEEKARECDEDSGNEQPEKYTLAQMIQIIWHNEPEWLHTNVFAGWTMDEILDEEGKNAPIWPNEDRPEPTDTTADA